MNVNHLDPLFLSNRHSFEIARLLLEHVFADWTYKKLILIGAEEINVKYNNKSFTASSSSLEVRRYLVTTFYQLLTWSTPRSPNINNTHFVIVYKFKLMLSASNFK